MNSLVRYLSAPKDKNSGKEYIVDEKRPFEEPTITELGAVEELTAHGDLLLPDSPHQNALI